MELVPILAITSVGVVGFILMVAAFVIAVRVPRFPDTPSGTRPSGLLPRGLMIAGATLGAAFGLLMLLPGVMPWVDSPAGHADLWLGAAGGAVFAATTLQAMRSASRRSGSVQQ